MGPRVRPRSSSVSAVLVRVAHDFDPILRRRALAILEQLDLSDSALRGVYRSALDDSASTVREAAVRATGRLRLLNGDILSKVMALPEDPSPAVRRASVLALGRPEIVTLPVAQSALRRAEVDEDSAVRTEAMHVLSRFHERGGVDATTREPTREERCRNLPPRARGCG